MTTFQDARKFLLANRTNYDKAVAEFRWPDQVEFNWALDWFDAGLASDPESRDRTALWIVDVTGGADTKVTFAQMSKRSNQTANFLRDLGLKRGDHLLLLLGNVVPLWETMLACIKLGVIVIPATTLLTTEELRDRLDRGKAKAVVAAQDQVAKFDGLGGDGRAIVDPAHRILTYDIDDLIYDGGLLWKPSVHTQLEIRAGHRNGGTTVVGSFTHQFNSHYGMNVQVFDTVETFGNILVNDISNLPTDFQLSRNPFTGDIGGCAFGSAPGSGGCFDRSLQSIRGATFRMRGVSAVVSGNRGLWDLGIGASYVRRDFSQGDASPFVTFGGDEDQTATIYGSIGRRLSRVSQVNVDAYASWYDTDQPGFGSVTTIGGDVGYTRRLLLDRLQFIAALGLYHSSQNSGDSTVGSLLLGLRYNF